MTYPRLHSGCVGEQILGPPQLQCPDFWPAGTLCHFLSLLACLLARGPGHSRQRPGSGTVSISPVSREGPWSEAQLREGKDWVPCCHRCSTQHAEPPPHSSGRPERGVHTLPNIWTSQRAKMRHPDVFKAPCWVWAEWDTWVEVKAFVRGERVNFVQRLRVVLAQSCG